MDERLYALFRFYTVVIMEVPSDVSLTRFAIGGLKLPVRDSRPLKVVLTSQLSFTGSKN